MTDRPRAKEWCCVYKSVWKRSDVLETVLFRALYHVLLISSRLKLPKLPNIIYYSLNTVRTWLHLSAVGDHRADTLTETDPQAICSLVLKWFLCQVLTNEVTTDRDLHLDLEFSQSHPGAGRFVASSPIKLQHTVSTLQSLQLRTMMRCWPLFSPFESCW